MGAGDGIPKFKASALDREPGRVGQAEADEARRRQQGQIGVQRVAARNAKKALRAGDFAAWNTWNNVAGGTNSNIRSSPQNRQTAELAVERQTENALNLDSNERGGNPGSQSDRNQLVDQATGLSPANNSTGTGDGVLSENAKGSSQGGEWVNVEPSATGGPTTSPAAPGASGKGKQATWRDNLGLDSRQKFAEDLKNSPLIQEGSNDALAKANVRGKTLGLTPAEITTFLNGTPGEIDISGAPKATLAPLEQKAINEKVTAKFSKEYGTWLNANPNASREEKDAKYSELKKENSGFVASEEGKKVAAIGKKAREEYLSDNQDAFDRIAASTSRAEVARQSQGDITTTAKERIALAEKAGADHVGSTGETLETMKERQTEEAEKRGKKGIAQDHIQEIRKELRNKALDTASNTPNSYAPSSLFEGNWMEDDKFLPTEDDLNQQSEVAIKKGVEMKIKDHIATAKEFNKELGGSTETIRGGRHQTYTSLGVSGQGGKSIGEYQTDAFNLLKQNALGREPNWAYDPNRDSKDAAKPKAASTMLESLDQGYMNTVRPIGDALMGSTSESRKEMFKTAHSSKVSDAQHKILNAAAKTGFPVWEDKELMADPVFRKRIRGDSRFSKEIKAFDRVQEAKRMDEKNLHEVSNATTKQNKARSDSNWIKQTLFPQATA